MHKICETSICHEEITDTKNTFVGQFIGHLSDISSKICRTLIKVLIFTSILLTGSKCRTILFLKPKYITIHIVLYTHHDYLYCPI